MKLIDETDKWSWTPPIERFRIACWLLQLWNSEEQSSRHLVECEALLRGRIKRYAHLNQKPKPKGYNYRESLACWENEGGSIYHPNSQKKGRPGNRRGAVLSEETRRKLSEAKLGKKRKPGLTRRRAK